jgi:endonuclease/exonuclease/phosphatase (EEP) superfamily protein YafD
MTSSILDKKPVRFTITSLIVLGVLGCMFTPNYILFKQGSNFAVLIMLTYLFLGLIFLALRQPRLTFTSFIACAVLSMFLKFYSNWDWPAIPVTDASQPSVHIAHFNIANAERPYEETMEDILKTDADILSFQEVTPDWYAVFQQFLKQRYPYSSAMVRFDPYGLAIYSKTPILDVDTFYYRDIPNLALTVKGAESGLDFRLLSSYTDPPIYSQALAQLKEHMNIIVGELKKTELPTFAIGDYNAPPWWDEIRFLMAEGRLLDSRSCAAQGLDNLWNYPVDYIFHSGNLECTSFDKVEKTLYGHLGIQATFQLNSKQHVQATLK